MSAVGVGAYAASTIDVTPALAIDKAAPTNSSFWAVLNCAFCTALNVQPSCVPRLSVT